MTTPPGLSLLLFGQVTINGIRYVVDTGFVKVRRFVPATGFDSLQVTQGNR